MRTIIAACVSLMTFHGAGASTATTGSQWPAASEPQRADTMQRAPGDALAAELTRCLRLGDHIVHDPTCLRAWSDYGRRFLRATPPTVGTPQQRQPQSAPDDAR